MAYKTMDIYEFGRKLLETRDLDPVYVLIHQAKFTPIQLRNWLLAYWCFYHCGTASWITEQGDRFGRNGYWLAMQRAAASSDYSRASERRHFRGIAACDSVQWLQENDSVFAEFDGYAEEGATPTVEDVMSYVKEWKGFGPWIAFKVADMLERLGLLKIDFTDTGSWLYESPLQAAESLWATEHDNEENIPLDVGNWAIDRILGQLGRLKAPPRYERLINAQEAETILCKWKSHINGHYEVGKDTKEIRHGLLKMGRCGMCQKLLIVGRRCELW